MEVLKLLGTAFAAIVTLFVLTKLMGNRQMSQLTMFDYLMGISIGSVAAEMATNLDDDAWGSVLAMIVFAAVDIAINVLNNKSRKLRSFFLGKPLVLLRGKTLYRDNLRRSKLDLTEFLTQCRCSGYFDLNQLQMVTMEINGKLSFLPAESDRPLTPADMSIAPPQTMPSIPVLMDGILQPDNLHHSGNDEIWLQKQLKVQGYSRYEEIFLALVDSDHQLTLYPRNDQPTHQNHYT